MEIGWLSKKAIFTFLISAPVKRFSFAFSINLGHLWPYCGKGGLMKNDKILQDKVKEEGEIWWTQTLGGRWSMTCGEMEGPPICLAGEEKEKPTNPCFKRKTKLKQQENQRGWKPEEEDLMSRKEVGKNVCIKLRPSMPEVLEANGFAFGQSTPHASCLTCSRHCSL